MTPVRPITAHIDEAPLRGLVLRVTILCSLMLTMEGMDANAISFVGPMLGKSYHIPVALMGWIYSATVVSSLIGAVGVAPLSDRVGRRTILVAASLVLSALTMLTPLARVFPLLLALRIIVGIAFGAAVPCAFALTADYSPSRRRALLLMITTSGVAFGSVITGLCASVIIAAWGWPALMYFVGGLSFVFTLILMSSLPESISFLLRRRPQSNAAARVLGLLKVDGRTVAPIAARKREDPTPLVLFSDGRAAASLLILLIIVCAYGVEFFLSYWLPTLLIRGGANIQSASLVTAAAKAASICGGVLAGLCMDRFGLRGTLSKCFLAGGAVIGLLSISTGNPLLAVGMVIATNFFVDASFAGAQALVAASYPAEIRGTTTGWITGLGRLIGGGAGTTAGGYLIAAGWTSGAMSALLAGVMTVAALAILALVVVGRGRASAAPPAPEAEPASAEPAGG